MTGQVNTITCNRPRGLVLIELIVVFVIILLMLSLALPNFFVGEDQKALNEDVKKFVNTLRQTAEAAMLESRHFDVFIDVTDGYYTVYEIDPDDPGAIDYGSSEPIIARQGLDECYIEQILFRDATPQYSGELILHATPQGWKRSIVFDLIDVPNKNWRFVRCDALTPRVEYSKYPLEIMEPRDDLSMTSPL